MTNRARRGAVLITWELPHLDPGYSMPGMRRLSDVAAQLMSWHQRYRVPATWAVSDFDRPALLDEMLNSAPRHDVAVLADASWASARAGRSRLAHSLEQRLRRAQALGCRPVSLVLGHRASVSHLDLLVRHRLRLVSRGCLAPAGGPVVEPLSQRYGVWQLYATRLLPQRPQLFRPGAFWSVRWAVRQAVIRKSVAHLRVDVGQLLAGSRESLATVERLLALVGRRRAEGRVRAQTLRQLAQRLAARHMVATPGVSGHAVAHRVAA